MGDIFARNLSRPLDVGGKRLFEVKAETRGRRPEKKTGIVVAAVSPSDAVELVRETQRVNGARLTAKPLQVLQPRGWTVAGVPCIECESGGMIKRAPVRRQSIYRE